MESKSRIRIGSRVDTPHGPGNVCTKEQFRTTLRWGVMLDNNPFSWTPAMYFENEITEITENNHK